MKIHVYATSDYGDGHVQSLGEFEDPEDIRILTGNFAPDIVITLDIKP